MKQFYLTLFIICSCSVILHAQPTLTAANYTPLAGENFQQNFHGVTNPFPAGANQTWDFSNANATIYWIDIYSYVTAASLPNASLFPGANLATGSGNDYSFFNANSTAYELVGYISNGIQTNYSNTETLMTFPFTYTDSYTDSFSATYFDSVSFTRNGTINAVADGYGTVILPWGTISDVLRIHIIEDYIDSSLQSASDTTHMEVYQWFKPGIHYPVYTIYEQTISGTIYRFGTYIDQASVGLSNATATDIMLNAYPNPCTEFIELSYVLATSAKVQYTVVNAIGQEVYRSEEENNGGGSINKRIDVSDLAEGIYVATIRIDQQLYTMKFVK